MRNLVITQNDNKGGTVIIVVPAIFYVDTECRIDPENGSKETICVSFSDANRKNLCVTYLNTTFKNAEDHFNALNSEQKAKVVSYMGLHVRKDVIKFLSAEDALCIQGEVRTEEYFELPRYECEWASYLQRVSKIVFEKEKQSKEGNQPDESLENDLPF